MRPIFSRWSSKAVLVQLLVACGRQPTHLEKPAKATASKSAEAAHSEVEAPPHVSVPGPTHARNFREAKRVLAAFYAKRDAHTVYSGCTLRRGIPDWGHCCLRREETHRAPIEWEHVVPAAAFGGALPEWRNGHPRCEKHGHSFRGRKCARRASERFQRMEGDMHNLFPELGDVNGARSNLPMGTVPVANGHHPELATCGLQFGDASVEPRAEVRGEVARAYLYMNAVYFDLVELSPTARATYEAWNASDPPDDLERERNRMISLEQGNANPWIR